MRAAGIEVDVQDAITPEGLEAIIADYDAIVVRSRTKVPASLIDKAARLKLIIRGGVGVDNIDVAHASAQGIEVRNTPGASSNAVAELTIGYMLALARQIPRMATSMEAGLWEKKTFSKGIELAGKTLGVIGCGRIGSLTAQKAAALGMEVLFYRRTPTHLDYATQVALEELLARADFIALHLPHTPETHHLINAETIVQMKQGVYLINCGRGGVVDEAALYDALVSGKVAGAALDVFEDEKEEQGRRFQGLPQVIRSPHIGAGTKEASARIGSEVAAIAIEVAQR